VDLAGIGKRVNPKTNMLLWRGKTLWDWQKRGNARINKKDWLASEEGRAGDSVKRRDHSTKRGDGFVWFTGGGRKEVGQRPEEGT